MSENTIYQPSIKLDHKIQVMHEYPNTDTSLSSSEYDDPSTISDSEEYDFDLIEHSDYPLPDLDYRNIDSPEKISRYAETIFVLAENNDVGNLTSSDKFHSIQTEITDEDKELSVRWLINMHIRYGLMSDTLYTSVAFFHIALCSHFFKRSELPTLRMVCMWLAEKVEERMQPPPNDLISFSEPYLTYKELIEYERKIVEILQFQLSYSTPKLFLRRYIDAISGDMHLSEVANFFCEIGMIYTEFLDYPSPVIAMSAVCLAKIGFNEYCPTGRLLSFSHIKSLDKVIPCAKKLLDRAILILQNRNDSLFIRYTNPELCKAILDIHIDPNSTNYLIA